MKLIILFIGALILMMGASILINPDFILSFINSNKGNQSFYVVTILMRTVIGILLLLSANESKHPLLVNLLGFLSLVGALILVVTLIYLGQERIQDLVVSIISEYNSYLPATGVFSLLTGGFLIYAFFGAKR